MSRQRKYWILSPNVDGKNRADEWKKEIIKAHVAIIGWSRFHRTVRNRMGPEFVGEGNPSVQPGDLILIARRHNWAPDMVGLGVVKDAHMERRFPVWDRDVSIRQLDPFKQCAAAQEDVPIAKVLKHTRALYLLRPETNSYHRDVCQWMEEELRQEATESDRQANTEVQTIDIQEGELDDHSFGYEVKTKESIKHARKVEAALLRDYRRWLEKKGRSLKSLRYGRLQSDGWEEKRSNLIEAKGSTNREDIRMAVGQLLDYCFQGKAKCKEPNLAILLPDEPDPDSVGWIEPLGIKLIWRKVGAFIDNAHGGFT